MNLPNKLTMLRIIMIPFFVFFILAGFVPYNTFIALGIFAVASLTDLLDGKIARKYNLVTNFGKFMDPLADKLLVTTALMCLLIVDNGERMCGNQILALIAVLIIVAREFIISGFRLVASDAGLVLAASMWGKVKTATTMVTICLMLVVKELSAINGLSFIKEVTLVLFWISVTLTVVSLIDYLVKNINVVSDAGNGKIEKKEKPLKKDKKKKEETSEPSVTPISVPESAPVNVTSTESTNQENFKPKFNPETGEPLE